MPRSNVVVVATLVAMLPIAGCDTDRPSAPAVQQAAPTYDQVVDETRHLVVFARESLSDDLGARVSALGGEVEVVHAAIGVATIGGLSDEAAATLANSGDVLAVERNVILTMPHDGGGAEIEMAGTPSAAADMTTTPLPFQSTAQFYSRQWNMRAIFAPDAWAAGHRGSSEVVVGILDSGIDYLHPDLVGLVDLARSVSFAPEDDPVIAARFPGRLSISDLSYHGTAVASIVASNGVLLEGVNRHVTLIAVKTVNRSGQSTLARAIAGIMYAADQGVDVINMSAAYTFDKAASPGAIAAFQRAANYAFRKGALIIAPAGNDAMDMDHNGSVVRLPCEAANAICVSGTGPTGAAGLNGPWVNVDGFAPYSAFGRSFVTVAAPSGDGPNNSGRKLWVICSQTTTETSPAPACIAKQPIAQPAATSFAAPHVTGLAALIVAQFGHGNPAQVRAALIQAADDLGGPGLDPFYGHGRINVARALGLIR